MSDTVQAAEGQQQRMSHQSSFAQNPCSFLRRLISLPPSRESLRQLAGDVAAEISSRRAISSEVATLYLEAAARHIVAHRVDPAPPPAAALIQPFALAAFGGSAATGPSFPNPYGDGGRPNVIATDTENSMSRDWDMVVEAVGNAAACVSPRSQIAATGILPVLADLLPAPSPSPDAGNASSIAVTSLTNESVEFMQVCLYAQQYQYCEKWMRNTWAIPKSNAVSVRQVLRYYYIRGIIHIGCDNWEMARRCFWTCLSIPGDMVSAISIAAWKKLILVQCRGSACADSMPCSGNKAAASMKPLQLPLAVPACLKRYLTSATTTTTPTSSTQSSSGYPSAPQVAPRADDPDAMHMVVENSDNENPRSQGSNRNTGGANNTNYPSFGVQVYKDLVDAFVRRDQMAFSAILTDHESFLRSDGNLGLVKQCFAQLLRHRICFYSRIYAAASLSDLSSFLNLPVEQVERLVLSLSSDLAWGISIEAHHIVHFPMLPTSRPGDDRVPLEDVTQLTRLVQQLESAVSVTTSSRGATLSKNKGGGSSGRGLTALEVQGVDEF